jgi:predicted dehydrogenase/threonine dehydrogenase-like Zn-dependent dehydrogenase
MEMKQILLKQGRAFVEDIPAPLAGDNEVLVRVAYSCISTGTETAGMKAGAVPLPVRLLKQPKKLIRGIQMIREQGFTRTMEVAKGIMNAGQPSGYSASGIVVAVGKGINDVSVGERVACAGAGIANHAEFIAVPRNLMVKVPEGVPLDAAATGTMGSIALQGIRRADPKLGEYVAVIGLGVLGQLTVQMLKANGCKVVGVDLDPRRIELAKETGMDLGLNPAEDNAVEDVIRFSGGHGVDSAIITASTKSSEVISDAMDMCRKKGSVIIVGDVGLDLKREKFYKKELDVLISTSYGPGRYDPKYESDGLEYPYAYVRWTENRNIEAYLRLIGGGSIDIKPLIEKVWPAEEANTAYEELKAPGAKPLIVLLKYQDEPVPDRRVVMAEAKPKSGQLNVALIGAGGFAKGMHLPNLQQLQDQYRIHAVASRTGSNATAVAKQYGASYGCTDYHEVLNDKDVDVVFISTRHDLHAQMATEAARAGKGIILEKPMALDEEELDELVKALEETKVPFMVGFNRRFSPCMQRAIELTKDRQNPMVVNYRMNAGFIPRDSWVQGAEGGGRNIGEACHIYDLFTALTGAEAVEVSAHGITPKTEQYLKNDNFSATISFADGSVCNLIYTAIGSKDVPKELMDIYVDGKVLQMHDYKTLKVFGSSAKGVETTTVQKGQMEELKEFAKAVREGGGYPIPLWQMVQATKISFIVESAI